VAKTIHLTLPFGMSCDGVVIPSCGAGTALVDGAIPPASSMLSASDSSAVAPGVAVAGVPTPTLKMGNVSPASPLSTGCEIDKSWNSFVRS